MHSVKLFTAAAVCFLVLSPLWAGEVRRAASENLPPSQR